MIRKPILKYPGGKLREWPKIKENLPNEFNNYYEPFVGGGSTWLNIQAKHYYINDISTNLMDLYKLIKERNSTFLKYIRIIIKAWKMPYLNKILARDPNILIHDSKIPKFIKENVIHLSHNLRLLDITSDEINHQLNRSIHIKKMSITRMKKKYGQVKELPTNAITAVKSALYTLLRSKYNHTNGYIIRTATYWFLREYAYSSMFRFNRYGDFNVPYGGASYNDKCLSSKLNTALTCPFQKKLKETTILNDDFYKALNCDIPKSNDFVFLDPPYDTAFSTYDKNSFGKNKQQELAKYLKYDLKAKFMLIIKTSPLIDKLYQPGERVAGGKHVLKILNFNKQYQVSFQNRNDKRATHLMIVNY